MDMLSMLGEALNPNALKKAVDSCLDMTNDQIAIVPGLKVWTSKWIRGVIVEPVSGWPSYWVVETEEGTYSLHCFSLTTTHPDTGELA